MSDMNEKMSRFVDGDLSEQEMKHVESQLQSDPSAQNLHQWHSLTQSLLKQHCQPLDNPEAWSLCSQRLKEINQSTGVQRFVTRNAWALCGCLALAIFAGGFFNQRNTSQMASQTSIANMLGGSQFTRSTNAAQASATERANDAFAQLRQNMGTAIRLQPVNSLTAVSFSTGMVGNKRAGRLELVDHMKRPLTAIVIANCQGIEGDFQPGSNGYRQGKVNGANAIEWCDGTFTFVLIGNHSTNELQDVANALRK